ncbi:unnamed protein product [Cunninghamella echinulata]
MYGGVQSLIHQSLNILHIGWIGQIIWQSDSNQREILTKDEELNLSQQLKQYHDCIPIFLNAESVFGHYDGYCKTMLWPLLHYTIWNDATDGRLESKQWELYSLVNQKYADLVIKNYQDGDVIWVHDYHLLLVPGMIRAKIPKARIGLFVHSPWPSSEIFRCLPKRKEILQAMIGANLVGFQTYGYARHLLSCCTRVLGLETNPEGIDDVNSSHFCYVSSFPIGINTLKVEAIMKQPTTISKMKLITELYPDKKIVVARDKLDMVKGVLQKLDAFETFLSLYPEWRNKVILVQLTDGWATANKTEDNLKLESKVSSVVARINGLYGTLGFAPIYHYHHHVDEDEYYALLAISDAALITSNRDGINTTAFEYIVCQEKRHSPLILSELTGTAASLSSALIVNPWDLRGVAKAIDESLKMSEAEKEARHKLLYNHVKTHTASFWANSFIKRLMEHVEQSEISRTTSLLTLENILPVYKSGKKRLFCFGFDGTLIPLRQNIRGPHVLSEITMKTLQKLCNNPKNEVWVISNRDEATLDRYLGKIKGLGLSGEHGAFIKYPHSHRWINLMEQVDMDWKNDVIEIFTYYTERTSGSFLEHRRSSITWNYQLADPHYGAFQAKECQNHLESAITSKLPVEIVIGKHHIEVRPYTTNKGEIIKRLLGGNGNSSTYSSSPSLSTTLEDIDFIFCCGNDDRSVENMFKTLQKLGKQDAFSVRVGINEKKRTLASWHLPTVDDVIKILSELSSY